MLLVCSCDICVELNASLNGYSGLNVSACIFLAKYANVQKLKTMFTEKRSDQIIYTSDQGVQKKGVHFNTIY